MSEGKIQLTVGGLTFSGEGEQIWLGQQLDKVLKAAPGLAAAERANAPKGGTEEVAHEEGVEFTTTLATYIKSKSGETNQVQRFLATADWLRRRGSKELTTSGVSKALSDHQQKRLGNPADCLNQNVGKGYCEKKGTGFFITPEGLKHLGSS